MSRPCVFPEETPSTTKSDAVASHQRPLRAFPGRGEREGTQSSRPLLCEGVTRSNALHRTLPSLRSTGIPSTHCQRPGSKRERNRSRRRCHGPALTLSSSGMELIRAAHCGRCTLPREKAQPARGKSHRTSHGRTAARCHGVEGRMPSQPCQRRCSLQPARFRTACMTAKTRNGYLAPISGQASNPWHPPTDLPASVHQEGMSALHEARRWPAMYRGQATLCRPAPNVAATPPRAGLQCKDLLTGENIGQAHD